MIHSRLRTLIATLALTRTKIEWKTEVLFGIEPPCTSAFRFTTRDRKVTHEPDTMRQTHLSFFSSVTPTFKKISRDIYNLRDTSYSSKTRSPRLFPVKRFKIESRYVIAPRVTASKYWKYLTIIAL